MLKIISAVVSYVGKVFFVNGKKFATQRPSFEINSARYAFVAFFEKQAFETHLTAPSALKAMPLPFVKLCLYILFPEAHHKKPAYRAFKNPSAHQYCPSIRITFSIHYISVLLIKTINLSFYVTTTRLFCQDSVTLFEFLPHCIHEIYSFSRQLG